MTFYSDMADTALELLDEFGTTVTLQRTTGNLIDPVSGDEITGVDASVTTTGILTQYDESQIDGVRIMRGDRKLVLSDEQTPLPTDRVLIGGVPWAIVAITTVKPDDATVVVHHVQVRR